LLLYITGTDFSVTAASSPSARSSKLTA
jgi:hypothetical protein